MPVGPPVPIPVPTPAVPLPTGYGAVAAAALGGMGVAPDADAKGEPLEPAAKGKAMGLPKVPGTPLGKPLDFRWA